MTSRPNLLNEGLQDRERLALDRTDSAAGRTADSWAWIVTPPSQNERVCDAVIWAFLATVMVVFSTRNTLSAEAKPALLNIATRLSTVEGVSK